MNKGNRTTKKNTGGKNRESKRRSAKRARRNYSIETDPVRRVVNKKLSTMSKESKEGKKNRKRPLKPPKDEFKLPDINPVNLLAFIGLIIVGVSLYYTRKTAMKEEEEDTAQQEEARERVENLVPETQGNAELIDNAKRKQGIKEPDRMDPFYAQQHKNTGIFTFDD